MRKIAFAALAALAATVGCRQCASPYDYCSPVVENGPQCGSGPMQGGAYEDDYAANRGRPASQNPASQNSASQYAGPQNPTQYDGPRTASADQAEQGPPQGPQAYTQ